MTKLQHLIDTLCPHGVPFKPLAEIAEIKRGIRVVKSDLSDKGEIPVYQNSLVPLGYYSKYNVKAFTTFIIAAGAAGDIGFSEKPYWGADDCYSIICNETILDKYIYYILDNNRVFIKSNVRKASIPRLSRVVLEKLPIPIPPMPVQEEIVSILDRFADYSAQLQAELQAELQARKAQYDYYRNLLLSFNDAADGCGFVQKNSVTTPPTATYKIQWKTMGEIGTVKMCKRIMKNQTSACGDVPFYKIGTFGKEADAYISRELYEDYKKRFPFPSKGTILISAAGTIGRCVIYDGEDAYFQDSNIVWLDNDEKQVLNSYLYHFYQIVDWNTDGGTIKRLYNDNFLATPIPIPPIPVQEKIVAILDRFEALVNDLCSGLPAEIEAVNARYEFYRNHLLSFTPLSL